MDTTTNPTTAEERPPKRRGRPSRRESKEIRDSIVKAAKNDPLASQREIAAVVGVNRATVGEVLAKYSINQGELENYRENQGDILLGLQQRICESITLADIQKAPMRDRLVGLGILYDKHRLQTGQSTTNIASWTAVVARSKEMTDKDLNPPIDVSPCDTASPNDNRG